MFQFRPVAWWDGWTICHLSLSGYLLTMKKNKRPLLLVTLCVSGINLKAAFVRSKTIRAILSLIKTFFLAQVPYSSLSLLNLFGLFYALPHHWSFIETRDINQVCKLFLPLWAEWILCHGKSCEDAHKI